MAADRAALAVAELEAPVSFTFGKPKPSDAAPCSLCGKPASGKYGLRVGEHRYVVCADRACQGMPSAEAARRLAARALESGVHAKPAKHAPGSTLANKGAWKRSGPRCRELAGCILTGGHRGKCYLEEK